MLHWSVIHYQMILSDIQGVVQKRLFFISLPELIKETCLVPFEEENQLPEQDSYNFITETFFMCHQAINQGFHTIHSKFLKINQELHRIQQVYQDLRTQYMNDDVEPVRSFKQQMEKGMF